MTLSLFVVGLDGSIVNVMLPKLQEVFHTSAALVMLVATIYLTVMAACQLTCGRLSDLVDPLAVFFGGVLVFGLGSLVCALSPALGPLLLGRGVQGLGGSMVSASFGAVVLTRFPGQNTGAIFGSLFMVMGVGTILGPPLGGYLASHLSWHWAFLINLPLCLLAAGLLWPYLVRPRLDMRQFDVAGGVLSALALGLLPISLSLAARQGWDVAAPWAMLFGFAVCLGLFLVVEARVARPLLPLGVFKNHQLVWTVLLRICLYMLFNGLLLVFPFYLTGSVGMSLEQAGWMTLASAITLALLTPQVGRGSDRFGSQWLIRIGSLGLLVGAVLGWALPAAPPGWVLVFYLIGFGASVALPMVASSVQVLKLAPPGQQGLFSGLNFLLVPVGGSLGMSLYSILYARGGLHACMAASAALAAIMLSLALLLRPPGVREGS